MNIQASNELNEIEISIFNAELQRNTISGGWAYFFLIFTGWFGIHNFYIGKIKWGLFHLILGTFGAFFFLRSSGYILQNGFLLSIPIFVQIIYIILSLILFYDLITLTNQIKNINEKQNIIILSKLNGVKYENVPFELTDDIARVENKFRFYFYIFKKDFFSIYMEFLEIIFWIFLTLKYFFTWYSSKKFVVKTFMIICTGAILYDMLFGEYNNYSRLLNFILFFTINSLLLWQFFDLFKSIFGTLNYNKDLFRIGCVLIIGVMILNINNILYKSYILIINIIDHFGFYINAENSEIIFKILNPKILFLLQFIGLYLIIWSIFFSIFKNIIYIKRNFLYIPIVYTILFVFLFLNFSFIDNFSEYSYNNYRSFCQSINSFKTIEYVNFNSNMLVFFSKLSIFTLLFYFHDINIIKFLIKIIINCKNKI